MRKMATWVGIGATGMFLIIASSSFLTNRMQTQEVQQAEEPMVRLEISDTLRWPSKSGITIEGDDGVYAVEGKEVSRNGVVGDYGEQGMRARRVAYFAEWMELDPVFASQTLDIDRTKKTIEGLKEAQARLKKEMGARGDVYGVEFLDALTRSSSALKTFGQDHSERNAKAVLVAMQKANEAYAKNIRELKQLVDPLREQKNKLVFLGGQAVSDYDRIADDLAIMLRNAEQAKEQIDERGRCLRESEEACILAMPVVSEPAVIKKNAERANVLGAEELHMRKGATYDGPYQITGQCWKDDPTPLVYVGKECPDALNYCFQKSFLAERTFYVEIGGEGPYKKFYDKGIRAIPQSATTPYDCTDLEYQMQLATLHSGIKKYAGRGIFAQVREQLTLTEEEKRLVEKAAAAEEVFLRSEYPSVADARIMGQWYGYGYGQLVMGGHAKNDLVKELRVRYQEQREQLADFYLLANKARFHLDNVVTEFAEWGEGGMRSMPAYIYAIRSHYALLYMNASSVIWRIGERPRYVIETKEVPKQPAEGGIRNSDYIYKKYGKETVLQWQKMYDQIMPFAHDDR